MSSVASPPPEQSQLADVRQRRYVVTEVVASTLPASPLRPACPAQYLVTLSSVEDDAFGEELQVLWELEPGTRFHERLALPRPMGSRLLICRYVVGGATSSRLVLACSPKRHSRRLMTPYSASESAADSATGSATLGWCRMRPGLEKTPSVTGQAP
jgi:hypothetical protein